VHVHDQGLGRRPFGMYLDGPRQGRADFRREIQVFLITGQFLQALHDHPS
jgi:hypothetical protein